MKHVSLWVAFLLYSVTLLGKSPAKDPGQWAMLENPYQTLAFNLDNGLFYIQDARKRKVVDYAYFQAGGLQSKDPYARRSWTKKKIHDELGEGECLEVCVRFDNYADMTWQAILYEGKDFFVFRMGINNDTDQAYRLMAFWPLISNRVFDGLDNTEGYRILDGNGGGGTTLVTAREKQTSFNNIMFRFGAPEQLNILVAGGLSYEEFEKFVTVSKQDRKFYLSLFSEDPVGKLIPAGTTYTPSEKFYLCVNDTNQFEALEKYGQILKAAQQIKLNYYDFPTECLWYASFYNNEKGRRKFNDSRGAVEEMDNAIRSGITDYTRVAIRLVPDAYGPDNQQGWWDDAHWAQYGEGMSTEGPHYVAPYLTTSSWAQAILQKGGIPITYFQSGRRSDDFARTYPGYMLFNDPFRVINQPQRFLLRTSMGAEYGEGEGYYNHWWTDKMLWSYDFTDPGFTAHMQKVYGRLAEAGIQGVMYDYPEVTSWAYEGGFEDTCATTAHAYRNMYRLAYEGLGADAYLDERCLLRGSDLTLGLVASQRVWADTDGITPEMVARCGLRWYKNRVVVNYDMDAKDPSDALPVDHADGNRSMLTMCYVTSGRFLLGRSFRQLSAGQLHDLSRTFPYHTTPQSARPLDAFEEGVKFPRIYDFKVDESWHQLTFYNYNLDSTRTDLNAFEVSLCQSENAGGLALDRNKEYYFYDFWNDRFAGLLQGKETLRQQLRPGEARMLSVHEKADVPQFIATDRHLMQGFVDMKDCRWFADENKLCGVSDVVAREPYRVVIATNGRKPVSCKAHGAKTSFEVIDQANGLIRLSIVSPRKQAVEWSVKFK